MWRVREGGIEIDLRLTPNAARDSVDGVRALADGRRVLAVRVRAVPEKGRANTSMIACLARELAVPKSSISLARGATARLKTLVITAGEAECRRLSKSLETYPDER